MKIKFKTKSNPHDQHKPQSWYLLEAGKLLSWESIRQTSKRLCIPIPISYFKGREGGLCLKGGDKWVVYLDFIGQPTLMS